ncbi:transcriptional regulator swi6 [Malassezia sp. CBS 17886]|nr:transcriptional regulator swi6 [Malassezia sp. CBS 17886]
MEPPPSAHGMPYMYAPPHSVPSPMYGMSAPLDAETRLPHAPPPPPLQHAPHVVPIAPADMPKGDTAAQGPSGPKPTVYLATYSSVPVYEITVRGIALMRRRSDGYLNATQILKIAGVEKARRTRILEKEILTGEHDKVQGGYGTFQGTWIPLQRAQDLAVTYSVYHLIRPLLDFDPAATRAVSAATRRRTPANGASQSTTGSAPSPAPAVSQQPRFLTLRPPRASARAAPDGAHLPLPTTAGGLVHAPEHNMLPDAPSAPGVPPGTLPGPKEALGAYAVHGYTPQGVPLPPGDGDGALRTPPEKRARLTPSAGAGRAMDVSPVRDLNALSDASGSLRGASAPVRDARAWPVDEDTDEGPRFATKAVPPNVGEEKERRMREHLTGLFVEDGANAGPLAGPLAPPADALRRLLETLAPDVPRKLGKPLLAPLNLVIDDHGHTALHWASALCRLPLVRMLTALPPSAGGASIHVGNYAGETALHRSVLVTNSYEVSQFAELLNLLEDSLQTRDHRKRIVLHHIALVAGLKGRAAPARYYLGCVLSKLRARADARGRVDAALLDAQDDEGETALSIAARLGNTNMIRMLLDAGARKDLPNYLGITPLDWGITGLVGEDARNADVLSELASFQPRDVVKSFTEPPPGPVRKSEDVREKLVHTLDELQGIFDREAVGKHSAIETTQGHLQAATRELAARRRQIAAAQAAVTDREEARQRAENLAHALAHEQPVSGDAPPTADALAAADAALAAADAAPAQRDALVAAVVQLRWLLPRLQQETAELKTATGARALRAHAQQRRYQEVVAMCAHVPADKLAGMLDELLVAVESIGPDVDMSSVASFMHKVGRSQAPTDSASQAVRFLACHNE